MKKKIIVSLLVASIALSTTPTFKSYAANDLVSVKLVNYIGSTPSLTVNITGDYYIENDNSITLDGSKEYTLKAVDGNLSLFIGDLKVHDFTSAVSLIPVNYGITSYVTINKYYKYMGTMTFSNVGGYVIPVNNLSIEDYVKGVVPREMPSEWNLEALKAQAIAARTYVTPLLPNVVEDTTKNQVYGGLGAQVPSTNLAVEATSGQILTFNNSPISAVFSSSDGGFTSSSSDAWGGGGATYLPAKADLYDPQVPWTLSVKKSQISTTGLDLKSPDTWWSTVNESDPIIASNLKNAFTSSDFPNAEKKIVSVTGVTVSSQKDSSGRSISGSITFTYFLKNGFTYVSDTTGAIQLFTQTINKPIGNIRTLLGVNSFKSTLVTGISASADSFVISGKGFGHGVGMSQYGAKAMGEQGKTYTDILSFYYPGTTLTAGTPNGDIESRAATIINTSALNIRSGPSTDYLILRTIFGGSAVSVLDSKSNTKWYKILYNGTIGYVSSYYVSLSNVNNPVELTLTGITSLHDTPNETSASAGTLAAGTVVTVIGTQGSWVQIENGSGAKWIFPNKDYSVPTKITLTAITSMHDKPDGTSTLRGSLAAQIVTVLTKQGDWYKIKTYLGDLWVLPNKDFTPAKPVTPPTPAPAIMKTGSVNATSLHMRSGAGKTYGVVATLPKGATVTINKSVTGGWLYVTYNGKKGYVNSSYIIQKTTPASATATAGTVNATSLNMRKGSSISYDIIVTLPKGAKVTINKSVAGGWLYITYNGKSGYVIGSYITQSTSFISTSSIIKTGIVTASSINMRSGSGTNFAVIVTIPKGAKLIITAVYSNGWLAVTYNGKSGYVIKSYVKM